MERRNVLEDRGSGTAQPTSTGTIVVGGFAEGAYLSCSNEPTLDAGKTEMLALDAQHVVIEYESKEPVGGRWHGDCLPAGQQSGDALFESHATAGRPAVSRPKQRITRLTIRFI